MLKIKDNVDLKELEKFGFKYNKENNYHYERYIHFNHNKGHSVIIYTRDRFILPICDTDILFDLITANLVEKVVEE